VFVLTTVTSIVNATGRVRSGDQSLVTVAPPVTRTRAAPGSR